MFESSVTDLFVITDPTVENMPAGFSATLTHIKKQKQKTLEGSNVFKRRHKGRWFVARFHMLFTFSPEEQQHILIFPSSSAATCRMSPRPGSVILLCFAK